MDRFVTSAALGQTGRLWLACAGRAVASSSTPPPPPPPPPHGTSTSTCTSASAEGSRGKTPPPPPSPSPFSVCSGLGPSSPLLERDSRDQSIAMTRDRMSVLEEAPLTHVVPSRVSDHWCIYMAKGLRWVCDRFFRDRYLHRASMLKTVALMPGLAGGFVESFACTVKQRESVRARPLFAESENHRRHLLILLNLGHPTRPERLLMFLAQLIHFWCFVALHVSSPRLAHRLSGYMGEESSVIFTHMINDIDAGKVPDVLNPAAELVAVDLWGLEKLIATPSTGDAAANPSTIALRDVIVLMRADDMAHRDRNHAFADLCAAASSRGKGGSSSY